MISSTSAPVRPSSNDRRMAHTLIRFLLSYRRSLVEAEPFPGEVA